MKRCRLSAYVLIALIGVSACASAPQTDEGPSPHAVRPLVLAVEQAAAAAPRLLQIRYNPARCDCPDWEALIGSTWVRCEFAPSGHDEQAGQLATLERQALAAAAQEKPHEKGRNQPPIFEVWVELDANLYLTTTLRVPVVRAELVEPPPSSIPDSALHRPSTSSQ